MNSAGMSANAFSDAYELSIGGNGIDSGDIVSMKLIRAGENPPVKGIVSSELIVSVRSDIVFESNAEVTLKVKGTKNMNVGSHFISSVLRKGKIITVHAMDRMRKTDIPFDDSLYNEEDAPFNAGLVLGDLASQCGFERAETPSGFGTLRYGDIHGKTSKEILMLIAENMCGAWYCTDENRLRFQPFLSAHCGIYINKEKSSPVYIHSVKGPFRALYGKNTSDGKVFRCGSAGDHRNILRISGRLLTLERCQEIMGSISGESFTAFYCYHADISSLPFGLAAFYTDVNSGGLIAVRTEVIFSGGDVFARIRTADICEDEAEYMSLEQYELRQRIEEGRQYGSTVMTEKGIGFVSPEEYGDVRDRKAFFFYPDTDGITAFDGAIMDMKMPVSIMKTVENGAKICYEGSTYALSWQTDEEGNMSDIRIEKEDGA